MIFYMFHICLETFFTFFTPIFDLQNYIEINFNIYSWYYICNNILPKFYF